MGDRIETYKFSYTDIDHPELESTSRFPLAKNVPCDLPEVTPLWPEGVPGFEPAADNQEVWIDRCKDYYYRTVKNVRIPGLYAFPAAADNNNGAAVIICPGGGYELLSIDQEGMDVARFFNSRGYNAFVLKYRMPAPDKRDGLWSDGPLNDAARAIRYVRANASTYGIDPEKVGIMGFSSGGHVAVTASTLYNETKDDVYPGISARPSFSILIYAVISLYEGYCHLGSRHHLLGVWPDVERMKHFSGEYMVTEDTPPAFLITTQDDAVNHRNSLNYYLACSEKNVRCELHAFPEGGHGYGMRIRGLGVDSWPDLAVDWLKKLL